MGQTVQPHEAAAAAAQFESGHACRVCESQILRLPGTTFHWCPTCGAQTHGVAADICACGSKVGKHDARLRCEAVPGWAEEPNLLVRRKVQVRPLKAPELASLPRPRAGSSALIGGAAGGCDE